MNKNKLKTQLLIFCLLSSSLASPTIRAEDDSPKGEQSIEHKNHKNHERMLEGLDLSEEQRKAIKEIRQANKEKMKQLRSEQKTAREALMAAQKSGSTSDSELKKLFDAAAEKRLALEKARFNNMLDIRKVLTPEQREQAKEKMGKRFNKRKHDRK